MSKDNKKLRSSLSTVRGLGSAHDGTHHFWVQRLTAVALIPLTLWFVYSLLALATGGVSHQEVAEWLASPFPTFLMIMLSIALFYHAKLGLQVVIEDYVHCECYKTTLLIANSFTMFAFAVISIMAVLKLHFLDVVSSAI